jgi:aspartate aminotransferase-like enzyme/predicted N-acetyltransferase YhbS
MTTSGTIAAGRGVVRFANTSDHEAIHRLNYRTFVEEIPQHQPNDARRLVDRFHDDNLYVVHEVNGEIVGMVSARTQRPFSLDEKLGSVDSYLPPFDKVAELRLLAVDKAHRNGRVFASLVGLLTDHLARDGYDLAVISGTTRQLKLYGQLGYTAFGPLVGREGAQYQPMYITLDRLQQWSPALRTRQSANFLSGPVEIPRRVHAAFASKPISHRSPAYVAMYEQTAAALRELTGVNFATMLPGSGTLANDLVAGQLRERNGRGLILSNGEFGERLVDHASRFALRFDCIHAPWGSALPLDVIDSRLRSARYDWVWLVHAETSTGVLNPLDTVIDMALERNVRVAVDAISSVGAVPVNLTQAWLASTVSGKSLQSFPGIAIVLHNEIAQPSSRIPRYLDLGLAQSKAGIPFTQSSNLVSALHASLCDRAWTSRFDQVRRDGDQLRNALEQLGFRIVADASIALPSVHTIALPRQVSSHKVGSRLRSMGWQLGFESDYLASRNWVQVCLMGEYSQEALMEFPAELRGVCDLEQNPT